MTSVYISDINNAIDQVSKLTNFSPLLDEIGQRLVSDF